MVNPKIFLVEDYPCERKEQLLMRERLYIENYECMNKVIPVRLYDEMIKIKKEYKKKRYKEDEEYRNKMIETSSQYYHDNTERIKQYKNEKYTCECGGRFTKSHRARHRATKKHQKFISSHN